MTQEKLRASLKMSLLTILVWILVLVWLVATLGFQITYVAEFLSARNVAKYLPKWTFFAPNPGVRDYHLAVRDRTAAGEVGPWHSIAAGKPRHYVNFVWNPQKRPKKILHDTVQTLRIIGHLSGNSVEADSLSLPYLILLKHTFDQLPLDAPYVERQFAIFQSTGHRERHLEAEYLSLYHSI